MLSKHRFRLVVFDVNFFLVQGNQRWWVGVFAPNENYPRAFVLEIFMSAHYSSGRRRPLCLSGCPLADSVNATFA